MWKLGASSWENRASSSRLLMVVALPHRLELTAWREVMPRTTSVLTCLVLDTCCVDQTNPPVGKSRISAAAMPTVVPSGTEKWGDIPASAVVGATSVEFGGKTQN